MEQTNKKPAWIKWVGGFSFIVLIRLLLTPNSSDLLVPAIIGIGVFAASLWGVQKLKGELTYKDYAGVIIFWFLVVLAVQALNQPPQPTWIDQQPTSGQPAPWQ